MTRQQITSALHDIVRKAPRGHLATSTRDRYLRDLDVWIKYAGLDPVNWTRERAQDFYNHLIDTKGLRPQSANRLMASVGYASRWWAHRQNNNNLHFAIVQMSGPENKIEKHALSQDEALALLGTCTNTPNDLRDRALIVVGLETGMRKMSMISMDVEATYTEPGLLNRARLPYPIALVRMKGSGDARVPVPLSDTAIAAIVPWRQWLANHEIKVGPMFRAIYDRGRGPRPSDKALSGQAIQDIVKDRAERAGIGNTYPHMFRHTFITWRAEAGASPHEIAAITGHTIKGIGALGGYMDMKTIGGSVRNSTPAWLAEYIAGLS